MAAFFVEQYWPGVTEDVAAACVARVRRVLRGRDPAEWKLVSSVLLDDETLLSLVEAPDVDSVTAAWQQADSAVDRVTPCIVISSVAARDA